MKRIYFAILMAFAGVTSVYSQLQVDSTGYVAVGVTEEILEDEDADSIMSPFAFLTAGGSNAEAFFMNNNRRNTLQIENYQNGTSRGAGLYSACYTSEGVSEGVSAIASSSNGVVTIGVRGLSFGGSKSVGVYGGTPYSYSGNQSFAGIYGSDYYSQTPYFQHTGVYAGYFSGTVRATGPMYAPAFYISSASPSGNNNGSGTVNLIGEEERVTDKLRNVTSFELQHNDQAIQTRGSDPVGAFLKGRNIKDLSKKERLQLDSVFSEIVPVETDPLASVNYGLDAEQLKAMFPKLVQQDKEGNYSINYIEMIPLLVKSINELSEELEELKGASRNKAKVQSDATGIGNNFSEVDMVRMDQNKPNPFSESTVIGLNIPVKTQKANIFVYDLSGKQVKNVQVNERGETNITVYASDLGAGMYIYTLVVDGKVVVTRRMIVEK
jgi:hypothetical protein